jgi:hypothetical protein
MATLYGPHIPYKEPGDQLDDAKIKNNWLEVERWAMRLQEQVGGGGCKVWFTPTEPLEAAVGDFWYVYV